MKHQTLNKSTVSEIQERFDNEVERFANLETGQQSTIDAPLSLELITEAVCVVNPGAKSLLDIGCGAGNYSLKMLSRISNLDCTLVDLSLPMLEKARERVSAAGSGEIQTIQSDVRQLDLKENQFDIILAGAVLHHLRTAEEWLFTFKKLYRSLKAGGSMWISDLIVHDNPQINSLMWKRYGDYLEQIGGKSYREKVFAYIEKEDSPRSLNFQLDLMKQVGFTEVEILHKNSCFAAFGGIKGK